MRYRLIPARDPRALMWHAEGLEAARASASESYASDGVPVLVCEAPLGGLVRHVETSVG
jgi:hypothetical protein